MLFWWINFFYYSRLNRTFSTTWVNLITFLASQWPQNGNFFLLNCLSIQIGRTFNQTSEHIVVFLYVVISIGKLSEFQEYFFVFAFIRFHLFYWPISQGISVLQRMEYSNGHIFFGLFVYYKFFNTRTWCMIDDK